MSCVLAPPQFDLPYQMLARKPTYTEVVGRKAVSLYRSSQTLVHPSKRKHALQHSYFCRDAYCKYHTTP